MELQKLHIVRKFIRDTMNLADSAKIDDFSIATRNGVMFIKANVEQEIGMEKLAEMGTLSLEGNQQSKYKIKEKQVKKMGKKTGEYSLYRDFKTTPKEFYHAKQILRGLRKANKLTTTEVEVMASFAGQFFNTMTDERKQEFVTLVHSVRDRLKDAKGSENVSDN